MDPPRTLIRDNLATIKFDSSEISIVYDPRVETDNDSLKFVHDATGEVVSTEQLLDAGLPPQCIHYLRALLTHVAGHTIGNRSNHSLATLPENFEWVPVDDHHVLAVHGEPVNICHHGVIKKVSSLQHDDVPNKVKILVSFDITDDREKNGLTRIMGLDNVHASCTFTCYANTETDATNATITDARLDADPDQDVRSVRAGDEVVIRCQPMRTGEGNVHSRVFEIRHIILLWRN